MIVPSVICGFADKEDSMPARTHSGRWWSLLAAIVLCFRDARGRGPSPFSLDVPLPIIYLPRVDGSTRTAFGPPLECVVGNLGLVLAREHMSTAVT